MNEPYPIGTEVMGRIYGKGYVEQVHWSFTLNEHIYYVRFLDAKPDWFTHKWVADTRTRWLSVGPV